MRLWIRQQIKMFLQHTVLPAAYRLGCVIYREVDETLVVFADAHHTEMPFSMLRMYDAAAECGYTIRCHFHDYSNEGSLKSLCHSLAFMFLYARARYVFICDNFLPVSSCRKRKETTVTQLWHSCGLLKKMGYDTGEDVPSYYKGNVYANYDLVTVSAPCCVPCLTSGMRQPDGIVQALGVSRTDVYFDPEWLETCRKEFFRQCPEARGKKILLWAPTFRGNASAPELVGQEAVQKLQQCLSPDWFVIQKVHPHLEKKPDGDNHKAHIRIPTERLLPVADLLITDYSSVLFDYLLLDRPFLLFAPDLAEYERTRGFYIDYPSLTAHIAVTPKELQKEVYAAWEDWENGTDREALHDIRTYHDFACDGHATERILDYLKMRNF